MWKKIGMGILGVLAAILALLAGARKVRREDVSAETIADTGAVFEEKAEKVRQGTADRIRRLPARSVAEQYGDVCDTVNEGRNRFTARLKGELDKGGGGSLD